MKRIRCLVFSVVAIYLGLCSPVFAVGEILGIHVLSPQEASQAAVLLQTPDHSEHYITVPLTLSDLSQTALWQHFFDVTSTQHLIPIIRLATSFENGVWQVPNRQNIIDYATFLSSLDWHASSLIIVLFNEPNHAQEWGGKIDPDGFAQISEFGADWFHTESKQYTVLPAGMDLSAPNAKDTLEAFHFWQFALHGSNELVNKFDGWTSHSYPNPNFASNPNRTDQTSIRGYQHELAFLSGFTPKQFPVYITETGWNQDILSAAQIRTYYEQAYRIWKSDPRIQAVTPFLLQGAPGIFSSFSFLDSQGHPRQAYTAFRSILSRQ